MSVVKINAMQIPEGKGEEFLARFGQRAGKIEHLDGFEGFQVLRPDDGRDTWLVVTRWRDAEAYDAWYATRPHREPGSVSYASGWDLWSFELLQDVPPAAS